MSSSAFAELVIWSLPGSRQSNALHSYKYRLAYVVNGKCVVRFDNEVAKGDHRHFGSTETPYNFTTLGQLKKDFYLDIARWNHENGYL
ncbi:toxin-antitoxin system TumE family protein [Duganella sp. S19_KUP01_CR8]|uniref:toxin-antitoxin system TumE family protein n=1 Tax=Duganella sp. S19_KUP01_CR8 TaxID=3025502 RepID=UPI002FCDA3B9